MVGNSCSNTKQYLIMYRRMPGSRRERRWEGGKQCSRRTKREAPDFGSTPYIAKVDSWEWYY